MKTVLQWIGLGVLALVVMAILGGATWEAVARANAPRAFPPPGRLVDIGGRRMQIDCRGSGAPTVVFEAGLDMMGSLSWSRVHDEVARTTRACAYSRAGLMWSDASGRPFSSANLAQDLHGALAAAGEKPPFVMVGHSLGGPYLLTYTARYGPEVAGLVFVDASHPDQIGRLRAAVGKDLDQGEAVARTADALAWTGAIRLALAAGVPSSRQAPPQVARTLAAFLPQSLHAETEEQAALADTLASAGRSRALGDRPLVVLTHGAATSPEILKAMKITAEQGRSLETTWTTLQDEEAAWSSHSRHEVVAGASHYIQFDRPEVVVAAVRDVVSQVRASAAAPR